MPVFESVVNLLVVINDLEKRGLKSSIITNALKESMISAAVKHYNDEYGPKPTPQPTAPQQQRVEPQHPQTNQAQKPQRPAPPAPHVPQDKSVPVRQEVIEHEIPHQEGE